MKKRWKCLLCFLMIFSLLPLGDITVYADSLDAKLSNQAAGEIYFYNTDHQHRITIDTKGTILFDDSYALTQTGTKLIGKVGTDNKAVTLYRLNDNAYILASAVTYTQNDETQYLYEYTGFYSDYLDATDDAGIFEVWDADEKEGGYTSLQDAVSAASNGDTIKITSDYVVTEGTYINKNVAIDGGDHIIDKSQYPYAYIVVDKNADVQLNNIMIDGGADGFEVDYDAVTYTNYAIPLVASSIDNDPQSILSPIITQGTLNCDGLKICNSYTTSYGGAINVVSGNVTLKNSRFTHNYGKSYGGAIYIGSKFYDRTDYPVGSVVIDNCVFSDNYTGHGGAVYAFNTKDLSITGSDFANNTANGGKGGALDLATENTTKPAGELLGLDFMQTVVTDCSFENNWAGNDGFAIQTYDSDLYVSDSEFIGNVGVHPTSSVGTVSIESYRTTNRIYTSLNNCVFKENIGPCSAYGDHSSIADLDIEDCEFTGNQGNDSLLLYSSVANIKNTTFTGEKARYCVIDARIYENWEVPPLLTLTDVSIEGTIGATDILVRKQNHNQELNTYNVVLKGNTTGKISIWDNNKITLNGSHTGEIHTDAYTSENNVLFADSATLNGNITTHPDTYTMVLLYANDTSIDTGTFLYLNKNQTYTFFESKKAGMKEEMLSCLRIYEDSTCETIWDGIADDNLILYGTWSEHIWNEGKVTAPTYDEQGYTTYTCTECNDSYQDDYVDALKAEVMVMKYDDRLDVTDKTVEIIDAGTPTSYQVGYGVEENTILDSAVVTLDGDTLIATGIGTAKVYMNGQLYEITVEAAPISLLLLIGQSNMQGNEGNANQSIICEDGQVYATYADSYSMTIDNATNYAASALTGEYASINVNGTTTDLEGYPIYALNEAGSGKAGPDSGFAYQWAKATGEKVWVVNAAHGGSSITTWQKGGTNYEEAIALFSACQTTLKKEIAAGHYILSHMGYFWCQGCADEQKTAEWYVDKFLAMHENLKTELAFDADSNLETEDVTLEFANIILTLAGHDGYIGYRFGGYETDADSFFMSFEELEMRGQRVAQYWMGANPELTDINLVCNIGDSWVTLPDGSNGVKDYFASHYENGRVDYEVQVAQSESWYSPTTPKAVKDSIHYNQIGYNEVGIEAARNALYLLGEIPEPETKTTVTFYNWTGFEKVTAIESSIAGCSNTLVVPVVSPCYKSKQVIYEASEGLEYNYYDLIDTTGNGGTLRASIEGSDIVAVKEYLSRSYLWECSEDGLMTTANDIYADNALTRSGGSIADGVFSSTYYKLANAINLKHDKEWFIEWTAAGSGSGMLLASQKSHSAGNVYLYRNANAIVCIGYYDNGSHNYGLKLSDYGIDYTAEHTYRVENIVSEDGNMLYLYADGELLGPMTNYYLGSALQSTENTYLSGKDFVFSYIGNSSYPLNNISVGYLEVSEDGTPSDYHVHEYSNWEVVSTPSADALGLETRTCSSCGYIQERDVEGVWQKYDLADHLVALPDEICQGTNLWPVLAHDEYYFTSSNAWNIHSSKNVYSVTIPVSEGDQICASSFGKGGENGHSSSNGIRVTFFDAYGVCKTLSSEETYAEFSANGYLTAPEGAVAINVPMWTNSDAWELYILSKDHEYSNTACTICDETHPNADNYSGKVISILGDSISTFAGYIPKADGFNLEHLARYPQDNLLTDVNDTWWMQVISKLEAKLGINDSWRGSTVSGYPSVTTGVAGYLAAMSNLTQIQNLGSNGTPDVILFYGGTNDLAHTPNLGSFNPVSAPYEVDLTTLKWDNLADAYANTLLRLQHFYPDTQIICLLPTFTTSYYTDDKLAQGNAMLADICEHYGVTYVDLRYCGISTADLPDGIHPDAIGMDYITNSVLETLLASNEVSVGENVVYSITHELENAESSLSYYKGISEGKNFTETLSGENLSVVVTMGGEDITDSCYKNGVISIENVTGDIVITAKAVFSLRDHVQVLPNPYYGVNLWSALEHDDEYFYIDEWTVHSSGNVYSVTVPVIPGEKIYASSFEAAGVNGGSLNGIRITFFSNKGVLTSMEPADVYGEFAESGYVIVPEGATAVNIPMWTNDSNWEMYIWENSYEPSFDLGNHLQQLPEIICPSVNLWQLLEPQNDYYTSTGWGNLTTKQVWSVTIPVDAGYKIYANSFKKNGENGNNYNSTNGIRVTWFGENGVLKTMTADQTYAEYVANGYLTAPEGTVAVNIPMWRNSNENELYILNFNHIYDFAITDPTCVDKGYTTYTCKLCGDSYVDTYTEVLNHSFTDYISNKNATCEADGTKTAKCDRCEKTDTVVDEGSATGHAWGDYIVDVAPTYREEGQKSIYCDVCQVKREGSTIKIPKIDTSVLKNPFIDVFEDKYYYKAVLWAYYSDVTYGVSDALFNPDGNCTRSQVITFLWRNEGCPEATIETVPFVDIDEDQFYYEALLWAYENDITVGTSAITFAPNQTVTRDQFVTLLWRKEGENVVMIANPFVDITSGTYYYDAVLWAYANGITVGTSATTFAPEKICLRQEVVTFLYRTYY